MKHIMDNVTATGWVAKFKDARLQASGLSVYQWHEIVGRIENDERYGGKTTFGVAGFPHMAYDIDGKPLHFGGTICIVAVAKEVDEALAQGAGGTMTQTTVVADLQARIAELEQELKNQVELHNEWLGTYRIKLDYIEELERKIERLTT